MAAPPDNDVLWARGLHYAYGGSPALQGVSLGVRAGEIVTVTGPRGSGKTTLLSCLSGRLAPHDGEVWFNSVPVHTFSRAARERLRRDRFGWVGSDPGLVPELTAWENAALPLLLCGTGARAARKSAVEWLERLDVGDCARQRPAALRQSQRQRVAIARALVTMPAIVFADEPTAPLHRSERTHVLRTLTTAARTHDITMVLTGHDPLGPALADRTLTLADGRLHGGPAVPEPGGWASDGPDSEAGAEDPRTIDCEDLRTVEAESIRAADSEDPRTADPEDSRTPDSEDSACSLSV